MKKDNEIRKIVERIITLSYDSLQSHLPYTYEKTPEGKKFHIDAIKQYDEIIQLSIKLYDLTR